MNSLELKLKVSKKISVGGNNKIPNFSFRFGIKTNM